MLGWLAGLRYRVLWLVLVVLGIRLVYLVWFSGYELVADEAQYWDWSRRIDIGYYTKGPGVAWVIAASTWLFGTFEWSVRAPAVVAAALGAFALARLTTATLQPAGAGGPASPAGRVAPFVAAFLFLAAPPYQLTALLMTTDGPYITCWILAVWCAWEVFEGQRIGERRLAWWVGLGSALGVGLLFKVSIVLLVPGLAWFGWKRRAVIVGHRQAVLGATLAVMAMLATASTFIVWNATHGWGTVSHVLDLMSLPGGDRPSRVAWDYDPRWTLEHVLGQIGMFGPISLLGLFGLITTRDGGAALPWRAGASVFLWSAAVPSVLFFLLLSFVTEIEGNWPIAAYTTLLIPAAVVVACRGAVSAAMSAHVRRAWYASVGFAAVACVLAHAPVTGAALPVLGRFIPTHRFVGFQQRAEALGNTVGRLTNSLSEPPFIVAASHNDAGRLAFYLPGRPRVASAARHLGYRPSAYDFFDDTDLAADRLLGQTAILLGGSAATWNRAFQFATVEQVPGSIGVFLGTDYRGPRSSAS